MGKNVAFDKSLNFAVRIVGLSDYLQISKLSISLKEANETCYWLELLHLSGKITNEMYDSLSKDLSEIIAILVSSVKTSKSHKTNKQPA